MSPTNPKPTPAKLKTTSKGHSPLPGGRNAEGWRPPREKNPSGGARAAQQPVTSRLSESVNPKHKKAHGKEPPFNPQSLMPTPAKLGLTGASSAALAAVLPFHHTTRFASGYTNCPTAKAAPWTIATVDFTGTPAPGAELGGGCHFTAVSRDPLNAIIEYVGNPTGLPISYVASFPNANVVTNAPTISDRLYLSPAINVPHNVSPAIFKDNTIGNPNYMHPHGSTFYPRMPKSNALFKFVYMTAGETMAFGFFDNASALIAMTGGLSVFRYTGNTIVDAVTLSIAGATNVNHTAADSGNYAYAIEWSVLAATFSYLKMVLTSGANVPFVAPVPAGPFSHLGHRPMPGIENRTTLTHIRVNGVAVMLTPDSAELAKGGRIVGCQVDSAYTVESFVTNANGGSATDTVINLEGSDSRDFTKGGYAFHKPYSVDSYEMQQPFRFNISYNPQGVQGTTAVSLAVSDYTSYMEPPDGWVVYAVATPPSSTGAGAPWPGGLIHVTHCFSIEYRTNDVWVGKELPPTGSNMIAYDEMMSLIGRAPQFHENPLHVKDLISWYNRVSPFASRMMPGIVGLLSRLGPNGAMLAAILRGIQTVAPSQL